jgi:hypothetical protein
MFTSRRKLFTAWIALFAFLYAAATPLFAGMRAQSQPDFLGALCTMGSVKEVPAQPAAPAESRADHQPQCVFCISGAWQPPLDVSLAVPVLAAPGLLVQGGRDDVPHSLSAALQPLSPRAPPRLV